MNKKEQDDLEINCLRDLDQQAIGEVYDKYFPDVYRYILFRLGDKTLAEDIASDVFINLLEALHMRKGPETNVRSWLLGTASHKVNDHFRHVYRRRMDQIKEPAIELNNDPGNLVELDEHLQEIRNAMVSLTNEQQHILTLRFGQGFSLEETARIMSKKVNAIKAMQFRAIKALNRKMDEIS
jgi:RNA polymerase sigma-70 factor (ECF subfamily)